MTKGQVVSSYFLFKLATIVLFFAVFSSVPPNGLSQILEYPDEELALRLEEDIIIMDAQINNLEQERTKLKEKISGCDDIINEYNRLKSALDEVDYPRDEEAFADHADEYLKVYPIYIDSGVFVQTPKPGGDDVINSFEQWEQCTARLMDMAESASSTREGLKGDLSLVNQEIKKKRDILAQTIRKEEGLRNRKIMEGTWEIDNNGSQISITYNKKTGNFEGRFALVRNIACFKIEDLLFVVNPPTNLRGIVFEGTEYDYGEHCKRQKSRVAITTEEAGVGSLLHYMSDDDDFLMTRGN